MHARDSIVCVIPVSDLNLVARDQITGSPRGPWCETAIPKDLLNMTVWAYHVADNTTHTPFPPHPLPRHDNQGPSYLLVPS